MSLTRYRLFPALLTLLCIPAADAEPFILYAGSYTGGTSKGIYAWKFDASKGSMTPLGIMAETPEPAHIWIAPSGRFLYSVNWEESGGISAFSIDPHTNHLTLLNRVSSHGSLPNHIVLDRSGRLAATTNYLGGTVAVYQVGADGRLSDAIYVDHHTGRATCEHQFGPKAHGVEFSRDTRRMYVTDLGLDRVYVYDVDASKPLVIPAQPPYVSVHPCAGPRRLQVSPNDRFLYVNHETDSEVSVFAISEASLIEIQTLSTLPPGSTVRNTTAEIIMDSAGAHLYVSNRGDDSIAVFEIDRASGSLKLLANVASGGRTPRNIRLDPTNHFLFCANENSATITVLRVAERTGVLHPTGVVVHIDAPGGMYFWAPK